MNETTNVGSLIGALDQSKLPLHGVNEDQLKALQDAQTQAIEALEQRYAQPNWFKIAAGFAKPQLGGFVASLGSAAEALGENVEQQRAQQLPIAQMRAQLAQTNLLMSKNKSVEDKITEWQKTHPGQIPPSSELMNWRAEAPSSPTVQAFIEQQKVAMEQQAQALQRVQLARTMNLKPNAADLALLGQSNVPSSTAQPAAGVPEAAPKSNAEAPNKTSSITLQDFLKATHDLEATPPGKQAPKSSAAGPGGLLKSTQEFLQKKYKLPDGYGSDPSISAQYEAALLKENGEALSKNGLDNNALNHRMMWWFGSGDMPKLMNADPGAKIGDILSSEVIKLNGLNPSTRVGKLISRVEGNLWDQGINPRSNVGESNVPPAQKHLLDTSQATPNQFNKWGFAYVPSEATYNEYTSKQWTEKENEAKARLVNVNMFGTPEANMQYKQSIKQLLDFAGESPENKAVLAKVLNNLNKYPPLVNAVLHAGEEGFHASFNGMAASVGMPIKKFLDNFNTPEEQRVAQMLTLAIDNANYVSSKMKGMSPTASIPAAEAKVLVAGLLSRDLNLGTLMHSMSQTENALDMYKNLYSGYQNLYNTYGNQLSPLAANHQIVNSKWWENTVKNHADISDRYSSDYTKNMSQKTKKPNE